MFLQLSFLLNQVNEKIALNSEYLETAQEKFHFVSISFLVKLVWLHHSAAVICEEIGEAKCTENLTCSLSNKGTQGKCYSITDNTSTARLSICFINSKRSTKKEKIMQASLPFLSPWFSFLMLFFFVLFLIKSLSAVAAYEPWCFLQWHFLPDALVLEGFLLDMKEIFMIYLLALQYHLLLSVTAQ